MLRTAKQVARSARARLAATGRPAPPRPDELPPRLESDADVRDPDVFFPVGEHRPWILPPELRDPSTPWARQLVEIYQTLPSWPGSIVPEGGLLLQLLIRNIRPRVIVETGTFFGVSTIWLATGLQAIGGGRIHSYDLFEAFDEWTPADRARFTPMRSQVERHLRTSGVMDLVTLHEGNTKHTIVASHDELRADGGVQLAFLDGDHTPEGVLADLLAVEPVLQVGGYVFLHDTFPEVCSRNGPRWLLDNLEVLSPATYQVCDLYLAQCNYGMTILRRTA